MKMANQRPALPDEGGRDRRLTSSSRSRPDLSQSSELNQEKSLIFIKQAERFFLKVFGDGQLIEPFGPM
jgi:hypothetical protein